MRNMSARSEEAEELLSKPEKEDLDYSLFDRFALNDSKMEQDRRSSYKWILPMAVALVFVTVVAIGLGVTLYTRDVKVKDEPEATVDVTKIENGKDKPSSAPSKVPGDETSHEVNGGSGETSHPDTDDDSSPPWKQVRLPSYIFPTHYMISIQPNLTGVIFQGNCSILVNVTKPTKYFLVHTKNLNFSSKSITVGAGEPKDSQELTLTETFYYDEHEFLVLVVDKAVEAGKVYQLNFEYEGLMNDESLNGLYRSKYKTANGTLRYLAATKFEPTDARRMFPSFDEPAMKAVVEMTVIHEPQYTALSNMPNISITDIGDGLVATKFEPSVLMSTYLVCIVVSDFLHTSRTTKGGVKVRVFAKPSQVAFTEYAANVTTKALDFYTDYFGVPYPLPKQDLVALPDFMSGAMENWGLITFRETALLYDPTDGSAMQQKGVQDTVVHELGHMWFGNLVTMDWWDDLWLNEGFARFAEKLIGSLVEPTWQRSALALVEDVTSAFNNDAEVTSHPIVASVDNPNEINSRFDKITYDKGASVIIMLQNVLGPENFQAGLHNYMERYKFDNAKTIELWDELSNASNPKLNVSLMMDTWTRQEGYPVIDIRHNPSGPKESYIATQQRFYFTHEDSERGNATSASHHFQWEVPLSYINSQNDSVMIAWMHQQPETTFEVPSGQDDLTIFNVNGTGFYLVNYDNETWQTIISTLQHNHTLIPVSNRAKLIEDAFLLSRAGLLNYSTAFEVISYLVQEREFLPIKSAITHLKSLAFKLEVTDIYPLISNFSIHLLLPMYEKVTWQAEGDWITRLLRDEVVTAMCEFEYSPCILQAVKKFHDWRYERANVAPGLRMLVYKMGLQYSLTTSDWDYVFEKYNDASTSPYEVARLMFGMTSTREPWLIYRYLSYLNDTTKVKSQDFFKIVQNLARNRVAVDIVWNYIRSNWDSIFDRFGPSTRGLGSLFTAVAQAFSQDIHVEEMKDFIAKYPDIGAGQTERQKGLDIMVRNIQWLENYKDEIEEWLEANPVKY